MFDLVALFIVGLMAISGLVKGLMRQVFSILALVAASAAALLYPGLFLEVVKRVIEKENLALIASGILTFLAVYLVVSLIGSLFASLIKGPVRVLDRLLGLGFGLLKGVLIVSLMAVLLASLSITKEWVHSSETGPFFLSLGKQVIEFVSEKADIESITNQIKEGG